MLFYLASGKTLAVEAFGLLLFGLLRPGHVPPLLGDHIIVLFSSHILRLDFLPPSLFVSVSLGVLSLFRTLTFPSCCNVIRSFLLLSCHAVWS